MSYNRRQLQKDKKDLTKAKAPSKQSDIIYTPANQFDYLSQYPQMKTGGSHNSKKLTVKKSNIQGKGLFINKAVKKGDVIGLAHKDNQATPVVGKYHNHSENNPTAVNVQQGNKRYLVAAKDLQPGTEITTNYKLQPELEQPEDFMRRGGSTRGLVPMPKPSKKGLASKAYSRSLEATNRLFTENKLFEKPKDRKRKVFDPNAKYYASGGEYGMPLGAGVSQNFIGNRDNFKVGGIPELPLRDNRVNYNAFVNGFEPMSKMQDGGEEDYVELELTPEEIQAYRDGGYVVEDISVPSLNNYQDGGVYTFSERPNSKYKKDSKGNWLISNPSTKNKYVPVKDPSGSRTKTLNRWAESQDMSKEFDKEANAYSKQRSNQLKDFESGIDFSAQPSETLNKVSGDYLGNFGMKSKNLFTDAQNKKAILKNEREKDEKVAHYQNTQRQVLNAKNLSIDQKKQLLSNPEAMGRLAAEYYDYKVAPSERKGSVINTMGGMDQYHQQKSPFRVLPYETQTINLSEGFTPELNNFSKNLIGSSLSLPNKTLKLSPSKLSSWKGIGAAPKNAPSGAVNMLDEYYLPTLLGGLALPEAYAATNAISKFAPIRSLPSLNIGNALTAKGVYDAGTEYIPNSVAAYNRAQDEGWTLKNQADLAYNALKAGLSLAPLSNTLKEANTVKNVKKVFGTGEYGVKLAQNPNDPMTHYKAIRAFGSLAGARQKGGETNYFDTELTDAEIQDLIDEGYIVEQL
jgi:hypothetical protein